MPLRVTLPLFKVKLLPARLPSILILPVPFIVLLFRPRFPPSCGDVSSTKSAIALAVIPSNLVPSVATSRPSTVPVTVIFPVTSTPAPTSKLLATLTVPLPSISK